MSNLYLPSFCLKPFPLVLSLLDHVKSHSHSCSLFSTSGPHKGLLEAFSSPGWRAPTLSAYPCREGFLVLFVSLLWTGSNSSEFFLCWRLSSPGRLSQEQRGRITSFDLLVTILLMQPRIHLAFWTARAQCLLMLSLSSTNTPKSFSSGLLSSHSPPNLYLCLRLPQPTCMTLPLSLLNFMKLAWVPL